MSSRILALDYGTKRIGVALSDELGWTAQPLETFERRTLDRDIAHIQDLVRIHDVRQVLLGLPLSLSGHAGPAVLGVHEFMARLDKVLSVPIVTWDERMTTKAAEELLIAADISRKKRKGAVDRVAAAILLKSYLESQDAARAHPLAGGAERDRVEGWGDCTIGETSHEIPTDFDNTQPRRGGRRPGRVSDDPMG